jgi:hypothetical protein
MTKTGIFSRFIPLLLISTFIIESPAITLGASKSGLFSSRRTLIAAVVGMVVCPNLLADQGGSSSLLNQYFRFVELVDDLFWYLSFFLHIFHPYEIITGIV